MAATDARTVYADDDTLRRAVALARRLPLTGRKPAEYLLAAAVLELHARLEESRVHVAAERTSA